MSRYDWKSERVDLLRTMWAAGHSANEIATELGNGFTRNSVCGKLNRLGLSRRNTSAKPREAKPKAARRRPMVIPVVVPDEVEVIDLPPDHTDCGVGLLELTTQTCRWPIGDPQSEAFIFCGAVPSAVSPYCSRHTRLAYAPRRSRLPISPQERERRRRQGRAYFAVGSVAG